MHWQEEAKRAAEETINKVHAYMYAHPDSELHRQGKMFGVLVCDKGSYLRAFSAMLDGSYHHDGFVPPIYEWTQPPIGTSREESRRLQQILFTNYRLTNIHGETRNLIELFAQEKPILSADEWFEKRITAKANSKRSLPPAGAGECCAPKLLQYAFTHGLQPRALAEFWVGAPSHTELRQEGVFYPPCAGKCVPILRHMLQGIDLEILRSDLPLSVVDPSMTEVLYEDDWLMVVNKPAGLLSVPGKNGEPSVEKFVDARAVHRLDQDTSGLLVLAKTPEVYKILQAYFQRRDILKRYEALLLPNHQSSLINHQSEGEISLPLLPNPYDRPRQMVDLAHGKPSITQYCIRERRPNGLVFIDFFPQTGRTHQLRVHAAHPDGLNAPIVGDRLYGTPSDRLYLHAAEIRFTHPITKEEMHFCIPSDF